RDPFLDDLVQPENPKQLTSQQEDALAAISQSLEKRDAQVFLLHGVTASGKTEVYLQAISHCLQLGLEAIVLVPEISLTPQTCDRFRRRRFGDQVSVMHSALGDGERFDEWTRINEGRSKIAVGARSALFAPFRNLGLIVVDEEHENTYKQDESPRYNARDIAVMRGKFEQATVVRGSATPSLESYYNCQRGRYRLLEMRKRIDGCTLPSIELVDMSEESAQAGKGQLFSARLKEKIFDRLEKAEQVILFLNRRGYATQMMCPQCGYVSLCGNCSIAHTYHREAGMLVCHLCGEVKPAPQKCPQCGSEAIKYTGVGTEKIESLTRGIFQHARIARMDSDTMTRKDSYRKVLEEFRAGRIDILIGTQMIAKGLDFPNVTLVGVLQADSGLHIPDFRSGERTFQLITQVAGRAGRGERPGLVIVQTYTPFHAALQAAMNQDYLAFYNEELPSRQMLDFPPLSHLAIVHFRSQDDTEARKAAEAFAERVKPQLDKKVQVIGPMPAPLSRIKTFFRWQLLLRGGPVWALVRLLRAQVVGVKPPKGVEIYVDMDPRSLM
ncbi:MAG: primosomal protein N', partial [Victivallales bacterium]|nr:primosomal protein N' [Victivallales bacterium]